MTYKKFLGRILLILSLTLAFTGCSTFFHHRYRSGQDGPPLRDIDVSNIPDATPQVEPYSKYGNPKSYVVHGQRYHILKSSLNYDERGIASWYGRKFHAQRTSSGEPYDLYSMSAAHKTLPLPCYARVTNLENGKQVIIKINDRGPFYENRIIDLSYVAAKKLRVLPQGTAWVEVQTIDPRNPEKIAHINPGMIGQGQQKIYLQIGAFSNYENAYQVEKQIQQWVQAPVHTKEGITKNHVIYRVRIGPLQSVEVFDELRNALLQARLGDPVTVVE